MKAKAASTTKEKATTATKAVKVKDIKPKADPVGGGHGHKHHQHPVLTTPTNAKPTGPSKNFRSSAS